MKSLRGIVSVLLLLAAPVAAHAGIEKAGTTAAGFLTLGAGADVLGMGGATLGFGGGLGSAAWNVASLGSLPGTHYVFSHATVTGESPQDWIAAGGRFGSSRTRWGLSGLYQGDGTFEGRDVNNVSTGSFSASSMALGFQVAQPVGEVATFGLGMKYASEKLGDVTGGGVTFDAGVRLQAGPVGFGAAAQNAFGRMSYGGASYDFPTSYGAGVSYTLPTSGLTFALDANFPSAYYSDVRGGVEWRYRDRIALRTGYRKEMGAEAGEPLGGPTFGMGAGANGFWLDYGFLTGGASGNGQHRVGLTYRPGFMNGGTEDVADHAQHSGSELRSTAHPTYVERAKAVRAASNPVAPKPAASPSRAPEGVAPQAAGPAPTSQAVAPAQRTTSSNNPDREPASPAVATPAPINTPPARAEAPKSDASNATPMKLEPAAKPAPLGTPSATKTEKPAEEKKPAKASKAETAASEAPARTEDVAKSAKSGDVAKSGDAAKSTKVDDAAKPAKAEDAASRDEAPAKAASDESPAKPDSKQDKLENAPKPVKSKVEEAPKPSKPEPEAPVTPRPSQVKVKSGQTLADIAKEWGTTVPALMMENNMVSEKVKPGQIIHLPAKGR